MSSTLIVVHKRRDWSPRSAGDKVISFADFVTGAYPGPVSGTRIINLCRKFGYLSEGYYCSLLAEARGHRVFPSVRTLNDLSRRALYRMHIDDFGKGLYQFLDQADPAGRVVIKTLFGRSLDERHEELARKLFEVFPCPILEITLQHRKRWEITGLRPLPPGSLSDDERNRFADALDDFSRNQWRGARKRKPSRYDLAILCDSKEPMPPSNSGALKRFARAGRELGIDCEFISQRDYLRLAEFDGLFIRATTNIDHYTYRFAKKAENEGLAVIDDSTSILRCTNKIYLADLLRKHRVPSPRTVVLYKGRPGQLHELEQQLGYPVVIKIPDGSFSRGVEKAGNPGELAVISKKLFRESTLLLAQEYLYTDFDWRIGILDNIPLYACRYYMVKDHWQIYRHGAKRTRSGGFDTLPIAEVPNGILQSALSATRPIGDGFYGVDVKERGGTGYVIEVNDNPSIESGVEDKYLGMQLYREIMGTLLKRMEARRGH